MSVKEAHHILPIAAYKALIRLMFVIVCIGVLVLILHVVSLIGLWKFWKSARELFIVAYLLMILLPNTFPSTIKYWWDLPLDIIYHIFSVAVIVFSYTSYTKELFNKGYSFTKETEKSNIPNVA
jgi:hypothetical protein